MCFDVHEEHERRLFHMSASSGTASFLFSHPQSLNSTASGVGAACESVSLLIAPVSRNSGGLGWLRGLAAGRVQVSMMSVNFYGRPVQQ